MEDTISHWVGTLQQGITSVASTVSNVSWRPSAQDWDLIEAGFICTMAVGMRFAPKVFIPVGAGFVLASEVYKWWNHEAQR